MKDFINLTIEDIERLKKELEKMHQKTRETLIPFMSEKDIDLLENTTVEISVEISHDERKTTEIKERSLADYLSFKLQNPQYDVPFENKDGTIYTHNPDSVGFFQLWRMHNRDILLRYLETC
ncbi:MAG: hypothetical protein DRP11_02555 [Candidatus Aenigmatarchaeota archaeon]|nr:MAG: hypothetical protein DRP11_02555 [Candidatus Aenigmarchaeota archaeon]